MTQIENNEIVLPAIQRDFVWTEARITMLFDSIMRNYPIGIVLLWETYLNIKYREFDKDHVSDQAYIFKDNEQEKRLKLVLDGQQRLQSLYIAIKGQLDNRILHFDVLSGRKNDDLKEVFYTFDFLEPTEAALYNENSMKKRTQEPEVDPNSNALFVPVKQIIEMTPEARLTLKNKLKSLYRLSSEEEFRLELNNNKLIHALTNDPNILKVSIIDENKSKESQDRKNESDILEAFVRINRQGITLTRSDLIFSMLKLNWKESAEDLPEFVRTINEGNSLEIDIDFVIRSLFAVSGLGSKFDVDLLRKASNIQKVKENYERTCNAIRSLVDFMAECGILNSNIIGGYLNLMPVVYYLANTPNNLVPDNQINRLKTSLYLFGFTRPFSRYGDSRISRFINEELKPRIERKDYSFPLEGAERWANYWESYTGFDIRLLQRNKLLTLHLLQGRHGTKVKYARNAPELDHIFPRSILEEKNFEWNEIESYGNFWILAKTKNQNKSNKHPKEYFADVDDNLLRKVFIDKEMLNYKKYRSFVRTREKKIFQKITKDIGLQNNEADFNVSD